MSEIVARWERDLSDLMEAKDAIPVGRTAASRTDLDDCRSAKEHLEI